MGPSSFFRCILSPFTSCFGKSNKSRHRKNTPDAPQQATETVTVERSSRSPSSPLVRPSVKASSPHHVYITRAPQTNSGSTLQSKSRIDTSMTDLGKSSRHFAYSVLDHPIAPFKITNPENSWPLDHEIASSSGGQASTYTRDLDGTQGWLTPPLGKPTPLPVPSPRPVAPPLPPRPDLDKQTKPRLTVDTLVPTFADHFVDSPLEMDPSEYPYNEDLEEKAARASGRMNAPTRGHPNVAVQAPGWNDVGWEMPAQIETLNLLSDDGIFAMPTPARAPLAHVAPPLPRVPHVVVKTRRRKS